MKIYFYRYNSICEPDVIESFKRLGFEIYEETIEMTKKNLLPSDCVKKISPALMSENFTFAFTINFFPYLSDVCEIMHLPYISLIVDSPVMELYSKSLRNSCNRIFLFDACLYQEFSPLNPDCIFHMPLAANVARTDAFLSHVSQSDKKKYAGDISFIGSTYAEKCPFNRAKLPDYERGYADGLIEAQLKIYGYNFLQEVLTDTFVTTFLESTPYSYRFPDEDYADYKACVAQLYLSVKVAEQERLRLLKMLSDSFHVDIYTGSDTSSMPHINNRGFARSLDEMPLIFNQSKININITAKSIRSGLPLRIFDVLGCGGFLITNYQSEIPQFFTIGKDLVTYDSADNLKELCRYYLEHEQERKDIALHGYNTVKKYHTYDIRLLQMLDKAFPKPAK